ncbi:MAG: hypothetical protein KC646_13020 [Candidatus Cloacimonetes bacterium]|nr:hypothetical protein [Candidatus Cloacimonadota bacterium]
MKILTKITGANEDELQKVLYSFFSVFFLLISYYMIKPLRDSEFLKEFPSDLLPLFFTIIAFVSLFVTKVFNYFYDRYDLYRCVFATFIIMMLAKVFFYFTLPYESKIIVIIFYFWAAIYFLLCLAITWSSINFIFTPEQSKRVFGFIALGAISGSFFGSLFTKLISQSQFHQYLLLSSALFMGGSLACILQASKGEKLWTPEENTPAPGIDVFGELIYIMKHKYVRSIAIMVFSLAMCNTITNFQVKKVIEHELSLRTILPILKSQSDLSHVKDLQALTLFLVSLKNEKDEQLFLQKLPKINKALGISWNQARCEKILKEFKEQFGKNITDFLSFTYGAISLVGTILLLFFSKFIFTKLGVQFAASLLPLLFIFILVSLFFFGSLEFVQILMILAGAFNYSLNNATKEILYTPTSSTVKGKVKPIIEGPIMRIGDVSASIITMILLAIFDEKTYLILYPSVGILMSAFWFFTVYNSTKEYEQLSQED